LGPNGRYIGTDVTWDSIVWCRGNISPLHPNFTFHHVDAVNEVYNPYGSGRTIDYRLPAADGTVDRIFAASVFTHLLQDEIEHYLTEFRRVLKPSGLVYASFFLYSEEIIASARRTNLTPWGLRFEHSLGGGLFANDLQSPRSAVAISDQGMRELVNNAGLRFAQPYVRGWWAGFFEQADDGQDAVILGRVDSDWEYENQ
jgi:hypothetical protein